MLSYATKAKQFAIVMAYSNGEPIVGVSGLMVGFVRGSNQEWIPVMWDFKTGESQCGQEHLTLNFSSCMRLAGITVPF